MITETVLRLVLLVAGLFVAVLCLYLKQVYADQQEELLERRVLCRGAFLRFLLQVCHRLQHTAGPQMKSY